jgi:tetratricopeptide (TPR) repeat protein
MSSSAYIATNLNLAFLIGKNTSEIIDGKTGASKPLDGYAYSQIRALQPEIKSIPFTTKEALLASITSEYEKQEALSMALEIMDTTLSDNYRNGISLLLDAAIKEKPALLTFVKNRLYSTALPNSFDHTFINAENQLVSQTLIDLYADLKEKARLFNCFETALKLTLNIDTNEQAILDATLTDNGCYAAFTNALYVRSEKDFDGAMILAVPTLEAEHAFKNKNLFDEVKEKLRENYKIVLGEKLGGVKKELKNNGENDPIIILIEKYFEEKQDQNDRKRGKRGNARRVKDYDSEIELSVAEMKDWILENSGDETSFFYEFEYLVKKQLRSGKPEHLCKTCCDLAAVFIENRSYLIPKKLLEYAEILNPLDEFVFTQKALLLHRQDKLADALDMYNLAILKFGVNAVTLCGKAEVLKDLGNLDEALDTYEQCIEEFPNESVAYNGKAEVLRDMGDNKGALTAYEESILKFKFDAFGYSGKAEVLRSMGRYKEALLIYEKAILDFYDNPVLYCGKAEVLRDLGRYDEALVQYEKTILKFDYYIFSYNGKAEVLRDLHKYDEALVQYEKAIKLFPLNDIGRRGRLQVLLEKGDYIELEKSIKKDNPITKGDYISLHIYCMYLIRTGEWDLATNKIKLGLSCSFAKQKMYFIAIDIYLKIQRKQFDSALADLNLLKVHTPSQSLLFIHANAEENNKPKAVEELHKLEINKRPVIHKTLGNLSERYSLNGFTKTGKSPAELDILILEGEMLALLQY